MTARERIVAEIENLQALRAAPETNAAGRLAASCKINGLELALSVLDTATGSNDR